MRRLEKALRYELNRIEEIANKIHPTNAPEGQKPPYLVYILSSYRQMKTLDRIENDVKVSYLLNILAASYEEMKRITKKVKDAVMGFQARQIGAEGIPVGDVTVNNVTETYESELQLYRGIIDVTFWIKEV